MPAIRTKSMAHRPIAGRSEYPSASFTLSARDSASENVSSSLHLLPVPSLSSAASLVEDTFYPRIDGSGTATSAASGTQKPKKPCNAFIVFRSHAIATKLVSGYANMSEVSCRVAALARDVQEEQAPFYAMVADKKTKTALGLLPETPYAKRRRSRTTRRKQSAKPQQSHLSDLVPARSSSCPLTSSVDSEDSKDSACATLQPIFTEIKSLGCPSGATDAFLMPSLSRDVDFEANVFSSFPLSNGYVINTNVHPFNQPTAVEPLRMIITSEPPFDNLMAAGHHGGDGDCYLGEEMRRVFDALFIFPV